MPSALNLARNTRLYFCTNTAGGVHTAANTTELQIMDGYTLTQATDTQTIQPNEGGTAPTRGSRTFNIGLQPADFSFSTYIRPFRSGQVSAPCGLLWNAITGPDPKPLFGGSGYSLLTSITRVGTLATAVTTSVLSPQLAIGKIANIAGNTTSDWDGSFTVLSVPTTTSFTYAYEATPVATVATTGANSRVSGGQWYETSAFAAVHNEGSNVHQLQPFSLVFKIDTQLYRVSGCALDSADVDFGLDQIAMIKWTGKGLTIAPIDSTHVDATAIATSAVAPVTTANFITNKLTTLSLQLGIAGGTAGGGQSYTVPITAGSISFKNNLTYLTPKILNTVNVPITYFTGARSISGTLNAYLRTGTVGDTGNLLSSIVTGAVSESKYALTIAMGGGANATRVEFAMPGCFLQIPTLDVQDIASTQIQFMGEGYNIPTSGNQTFDLSKNNDLVIRYYSA